MLSTELEASIKEIAEENQLDPELFAAFVDIEGVDIEESLNAFQDQFTGLWESIKAWAENFIDEAGMLDSMPEHLRYYFDIEAWARDCELGGDIYALKLSNGYLAVFWNH